MDSDNVLFFFTLHNLKWSDYANARILLAKQFCSDDAQFFVQL